MLIEKYDISTGNVALFANGIKVCCLEKMECRESIRKIELDTVIQNIKDDISKGPQNPAHSWIKKLDFSISNNYKDSGYFEGKKATPQDIAMQLPVRRRYAEEEIEQSIQKNRVTVIKASSGQGKTTMVLQAAFNLNDEYTPYQLVWCNDAKELDNIVQYFISRVKLGEKPLIIIDNLDYQLSEWNRLAQLLQEEVSYNFKLLLTTREDDWYSYSGNLSNVKALQIVKLSLNEQEAKSIFEVLQKAKKLHKSISYWRNCWKKVADKKLLIEYVYLLTHGEMISERINDQISQISNTITGKVKCEILRKVCFADICGIKLSVKKLVGSLIEPTNSDYGELLKSMENEFLIRVVNTKEKYVEGLHPVRSQHIVDKLHEFAEINDTAVQVVEIADIAYLSKLFSNFPRLIINKKDFYSEIVKKLWNADNLSSYVLALKGLLSGSVMQYYVQNHGIFDDANNHGGLFLISMELNPFTKFGGFEYSLQTLNKLKKINPDNINIQYLCDLRDSAPKVILSETDIYCFSEALFDNFKGAKLSDLTNDVSSYAIIAYWLLNIDRKFNLSNNISLNKIWDNKDNYTIDVISNIMYTCFCGSKKTYMSFVDKNFSTIMVYLKRSTESLKLYMSEDRKEIHVEYILLPSNIQKGNEESVSRLKAICKSLPIFETYCADAIKPTLDIVSRYNIPDNAHKTMPIRNIIIMFHKEFTSLWNKTIMSNYECDSIFEWLNHWLFIRKNISVLFEKCITGICRLLEDKPSRAYATEIDYLRAKISKELISEFRYPNQDRPFGEKSVMPEGFSEINADYFCSIQNFINQLVKFFTRDQEKGNLALINLEKAQYTLYKMQKYFGDIIDEQGVLLHEHEELCVDEERNIQTLIITCRYFQEHMPSKFFDKYEIKSWYNKNYEQIMIDSKNALRGASAEFLLTYPQKYYSDSILKFYPIIVDNLDITNPEILIKFLYLCTPIVSLDYNYLVVANKNEKSQIMPNGLRVPIQFLKELKFAIDAKDEELIQKLSLPFPEEIKQQFLKCFKQKYKLFVPIYSGYEGLDKILEFLWELSTSRDELSDVADSDYFASIEENLHERVFKLLETYKNKIPDIEFNELAQVCKNTFNGYNFGDIMLNDFYNKLLFKETI